MLLGMMEVEAEAERCFCPVAAAERCFCLVAVVGCFCLVVGGEGHLVRRLWLAAAAAPLCWMQMCLVLEQRMCWVWGR